MDKTQIVILAGGQGKRMNANVPKVLVPFHGKPMIDHLLDAVSHSDIKAKPLVVVGYKKEDVINHLGERADFVVQTDQLGTGHAVRITEENINEDIENVLVLYGDSPAVTGAMIANLANTHKTSGKVLTMATVKLPNFEDWYQVFYRPFSRIVRDANGEIVRSVEFKDANDTEKEITEINPCYFCFNSKWLFEELKNLKNENAQGEYYLTDLVQKAAEIGSITSVAISPEEALGVNSVEELEKLEGIVKKS